MADDPYYDKETDTYRVIHKGHPSASAVTNSEGVTVFFDPDNNDVLGFSIATVMCTQMYISPCPDPPFDSRQEYHLIPSA